MRIGFLSQRDTDKPTEGVEHLGTTFHMAGSSLYRNKPAIVKARSEAIEAVQLQHSFRQLIGAIRSYFASLLVRNSSVAPDTVTELTVTEGIAHSHVVGSNLYAMRGLESIPRTVIPMVVRPRGVMAL